ncbi:MAG: hypothetical protein V3V78_04710 [Candidatus Woesearchaeota archaeon]
MVRDLTYRKENIRTHFKDAIAHPDDIYFTRVDVSIERDPKIMACCQSGDDFFSRIDFREDAAKAIKKTFARITRYDEPQPELPEELVAKIKNMEGRILISEQDGIKIEVGSYDFKRLAQMAQDDHRYTQTDDDDENQILTKEEFLINYRGGFVDFIWHNMYRHPEEMTFPPN